MVTVRIPQAPVSALFPNARNRRGGFYKGLTAAKECRELAKQTASSLHLKRTITKPVHVTVHARYGYNRTLPDADASMSACKPYLDGIVDAKVLKDDSLIKMLTITHEKIPHKRNGPRSPGETIITIEEMP